MLRLVSTSPDQRGTDIAVAKIRRRRLVCHWPLITPQIRLRRLFLLGGLTGSGERHGLWLAGHVVINHPAAIATCRFPAAGSFAARCRRHHRWSACQFETRWQRAEIRSQEHTFSAAQERSL